MMMMMVMVMILVLIFQAEIEPGFFFLLLSQNINRVCTGKNLKNSSNFYRIRLLLFTKLSAEKSIEKAA